MTTFGRNRGIFGDHHVVRDLEDVDVSSAMAGSVLIYTGASWVTGELVEFYGTSAITAAATTTITTAGTWAVVGGFTIGESLNITVGTSEMTVAASYTDEITRVFYHASLVGQGADQIFEHSVFKNGEALIGMMARSLSGVGNVAVLGMTRISQGDVLEVKVRNTTGTDDMEFHYAGFSIT